nr:unnamed protein product [Callosobruchus analis]
MCYNVGINVDEENLFTLHFADDQVILAEDKGNVYYKLDEDYDRWGLTINTVKTEDLVIGNVQRNLHIPKAPNFAGPVLAFAQTIHMSASFISPLIAFHILDEKEHLMSSWRYVFYLTCFVAISTYVVYQIWGTAEFRSWIVALSLQHLLWY